MVLTVKICTKRVKRGLNCTTSYRLPTMCRKIKILRQHKILIAMAPIGNTGVNILCQLCQLLRRSDLIRVRLGSRTAGKVVGNPIGVIGPHALRRTVCRLHRKRQHSHQHCHAQQDRQYSLFHHSDTPLHNFSRGTSHARSRLSLYCTVKCRRNQAVLRKRSIFCASGHFPVLSSCLLRYFVI